MLCFYGTVHENGTMNTAIPKRASLIHGRYDFSMALNSSPSMLLLSLPKLVRFQRKALSIY